MCPYVVERDTFGGNNEFFAIVGLADDLRIGVRRQDKDRCGSAHGFVSWQIRSSQQTARFGQRRKAGNKSAADADHLALFGDMYIQVGLYDLESRYHLPQIDMCDAGVFVAVYAGNLGFSQIGIS